MSVEVAFPQGWQLNRLAIGALSEEFTLTTAELSDVQDRKVLRDLAGHPDQCLNGVKSVSLALCSKSDSWHHLPRSAEPCALMAQGKRDMLMTEAEKKAASLPPALPFR